MRKWDNEEERFVTLSEEEVGLILNDTHYMPLLMCVCMSLWKYVK